MTTPDTTPADVLQRFNRITVVGAGTIGISWAALFLGHGLTVTINDPAPDIETRVRAELADLAPMLAELGLSTEGLADRLRFEADLERAVAGADAVVENGPENLAFKRELFGRIEKVVGPDALLLTSTSGIRATDIARDLTRPGRLLVGHPFNPPHLVPLVEVVPGERTDPAAVDDAVRFYQALGKRPLVLRKEVPGFVGNRLQAALFREAVHLVEQGVVDIAELDEVVTSSIGMRWAASGPFRTFHLAGGPGGLPHFLAHLGPGLELRWTQLGDPHFDEPTVATLTEQAESAFGATPYQELQRQRDHDQLAIQRALGDRA
ncbi:MAG TPA: 3-hydroxyacyl-CoA dehydrogenase NAD-binding domain-containing protein [Pseudonocardia sp.]|uniref:3-hydroxyacyl-CoA dehydrogenase NAD-binding domain-containing protein n=1 Tax=Pseudonocardia sp. TaxID=60912 RepID=UPI002C29EDB7|nr:3-hydroxyacyl-CoA dehydrogenase NAD-binding domain-containing protein [Pseudonocardia sp.]HTF47116.1 3-hydroxyacyl-CoA dehydrogenase NAD-binding domain-containing protein [Pseudonocardia sp.]